MGLNMISKNRLQAGFFAILIVVILVCWFYGKFFPAQKGEWVSDSPENFSEEKTPNFGFGNNNFWISVDYPGKQNLCLDIYPKNVNLIDKNFTVSVVQSPRAASYPLAGGLDLLLEEQTPPLIAENIKQDKPFLLNHLEKNIMREGKDLFFVSESEKFLIPTRNIFTAHFPNLSMPEPGVPTPQLNYANKLVNFPEGTLLSDGKGVFVMSNRKLALIRSPEIFTSLGYKWEEIRQMSDADKTFNPYLSGNLIDFDAAYPNGTLIQKNGQIFLVWNEKLYFLSEEEKNKYFSASPLIAVREQKYPTECHFEDKYISCCLNSFDPRLNAPDYFPFANTASWDLANTLPRNEISKISWQSKIVINKENALRRLKSLANFVLYTSGIVK